ncbi:DNA repair protein RadA [Anaerosalibacter sp. Marseille-P3206]|uniref:DNA repair protein RadA n=1 Tax=Anaerosalibacter sp. Marseille-P3206 TaxID=1871005 RepID=UPI0009849CF8|nr:DNA repair protein RadA [Anaerosalibacter sp. Marseille-P3206]
MAKIKTKFICQNCGYESFKWLGKCPSCNEWNSFVEEVYEKNNVVKVDLKSVSVGKLIDVKIDKEDRIMTKINELDRVLGGGIVKGSLILVGGDPGIGKSTLLIQVASELSNSGLKVLYVSGEESPKQVKMRADRLNLKSDELFILAETNLDIIKNTINDISPDILIVDSIQTVYDSDITSAPGSVSQVREATHALMKIAKSDSIATFIVGHVTKEGSIAGPRVLEHMVDTVLYFEGEMYQSYRILRAVKNRFGSTNEIGMFEMRDIGLVEVENPSEVLISGRPQNTSGTVIVPCIEGTRPMLVEVQSLVSQTAFGLPRRATMGIDYNRAILMIAVLEKKLGYSMQNCDVYINVVGGLQTKEPAMDLGIITSIASSYRDLYIDSKTIVMGEVGLTGEIRRVSFIDKRINEAAKLGFKRAIIPKINFKDMNSIDGIEVIGINKVEEALEIVLGG